MNPPRFLLLDFIVRCNQRCTHCTNWMHTDRMHEYLTEQEHVSILHEFAALSPNGSLIPCGGEALLEWGRFMRLCKAARDCGLKVLHVTNGTLVSKRKAEVLVESGPHELSVSFDHFVEAEHDTLRRDPGGFGRAVRGVRWLNEARAGSSLKLFAMGLIHAGNYERLPEFYRFALHGLKVDRLKLNIAQPSFGSHRDDPWFEGQDIDPDKLDLALDQCAIEFGIEYNPQWRAAVRTYAMALHRATPHQRLRGWSSGIETGEVICNAGERNIHVGNRGELRLCWGRHFPAWNWSPGCLHSFWEQASWRSQLRQCKRLCGVSHSVRRESARLR